MFVNEALQCVLEQQLCFYESFYEFIFLSPCHTIGSYWTCCNSDCPFSSCFCTHPCICNGNKTFSEEGKWSYLMPAYKLTKPFLHRFCSWSRLYRPPKFLNLLLTSLATWINFGPPAVLISLDFMFSIRLSPGQMNIRKPPSYSQRHLSKLTLNH